MTDQPTNRRMDGKTGSYNYRRKLCFGKKREFSPKKQKIETWNKIHIVFSTTIWCSNLHYSRSSSINSIKKRPHSIWLESFSERKGPNFRNIFCNITRISKLTDITLDHLQFLNLHSPLCPSVNVTSSKVRTCRHF